MNSNKKNGCEILDSYSKKNVSEHRIQYKKCIKELNDRMAMCF